MFSSTLNCSFFTKHNFLKWYSTSKFYPWLLISLCSSLLFYKYILTVSPGIMAHDLMREFQINGVELGNLAAAYFYSYTLVQIFSGIFLDRFGVRVLTGCSILIAAMGTWLFSSAESLTIAFLGRAMIGFGLAFATVTYLKMTAVWFKPNQVAFVTGLLATAVMLGAVFGEAPLAYLLQMTSWRFVLKFCSVLGVMISIIFIALVRDNPDPKYKKLEALDERKTATKEKFNVQQIKKVLGNSQNWLLTFYSGLAFAPLSVLAGLWGTPFLQLAHHLSLTQSSGMISLMFLGLGLGSPLFGLLSDRINNRVRVMKFGIILSLVSILSVIYIQNLPVDLVGVFLFLLGFGVGAFMLGFTLGTQINSLALAGTVVALINTGDSIFESFTEPLLGKLLDLNWGGTIVNGVRFFSLHDYHLAFIPLPLYFLASLIILFFIKEPRPC